MLHIQSKLLEAELLELKELAKSLDENMPIPRHEEEEKQLSILKQRIECLENEILAKG